MESLSIQLPKLSTSDFCFFLETDETDGDTYAYFCPMKFFKENGHMSDLYYDILDEIVPADMDEVMDNCYACSRAIDVVEAQLLSLGFTKNLEFWEFMEQDVNTPLSTGDLSVVS